MVTNVRNRQQDVMNTIYNVMPASSAMTPHSNMQRIPLSVVSLNHPETLQYLFEETTNNIDNIDNNDNNNEDDFNTIKLDIENSSNNLASSSFQNLKKMMKNITTPRLKTNDPVECVGLISNATSVSNVPSSQ